MEKLEGIDRRNNAAFRHHLAALQRSARVYSLNSDSCRARTMTMMCNCLRSLWQTALVALLLGVPAASAQPQRPADAMAGLPGDTQAWLDQALDAASAVSGTPLRMEVSVGSLDRRLTLAPCAAVEPYVPSGMRLWGRTRIGLRCVDGTVRWNVFLPLQVKALGPAWVIKGDIAAGAVLTEGDAMQVEVDWAQENSPILGDAGSWVGHTATRALTTGQALRQGMVRPAQVFQAGAIVRVVAQGPGFSVAADGRALSAGVVGAPARVRIDNGRVLSGVVLDGRTVRVDL